MFLVTDTATGLDLRHGQHHHSITESQAAAIELALRDGWSVDRHVTAEDSLGLMISARGSVGLETVFYVDAEPVGLSLSIMRDEELEHMGCYGSVGGLTDAIRTTAA